MNTYNEAELVRLELLAYDTPDNLHPVEKGWRNLAKKLLSDLKEAERALRKHHGRVPENGVCFDCQQSAVLRQWPEPFKQNNNIFTK